MCPRLEARLDAKGNPDADPTYWLSPPKLRNPTTSAMLDLLGASSFAAGMRVIRGSMLAD